MLLNANMNERNKKKGRKGEGGREDAHHAFGAWLVGCPSVQGHQEIGDRKGQRGQPGEQMGHMIRRTVLSLFSSS